MTSDCNDSFCKRFAEIVNSDFLAIQARINISPEQVSVAARQLPLKLQDGRIRASDIVDLCSRIAGELDNRTESCWGHNVYKILKNIIERNWNMLVND